MQLWKDGMPLMKERHPPPQVSLPCLLLSLLVAFTVVLQVPVSGHFSFPSLVFLNFSDPGILHQGPQDGAGGMGEPHSLLPAVVATVLLPLPTPDLLLPLVECLNNCISQCNLGFFMLLVLSLCLSSGTMLLACVVFLVHTTQLPFCLDKVI
ncbi:hypothetical protein HPG69_007172, partial [Diceros bicornis minor]